MAITVPMIEEKEFKTKVRGYDPVEVDEFLDEICDEMILMQEEISNLQARLAQASRNLAYAQPAPAPAPAPRTAAWARRAPPVRSFPRGPIAFAASRRFPDAPAARIPADPPAGRTA